MTIDEMRTAAQRAASVIYRNFERMILLGPGSSPWRRIFDRLFFGGNDWGRLSFQKTGSGPVF